MIPKGAKSPARERPPGKGTTGPGSQNIECRGGGERSLFRLLTRTVVKMADIVPTGPQPPFEDQHVACTSTQAVPQNSCRQSARIRDALVGHGGLRQVCFEPE